MGNHAYPLRFIFSPFNLSLALYKRSEQTARFQRTITFDSVTNTKTTDRKDIKQTTSMLKKNSSYSYPISQLLSTQISRKKC